ncbi:hypothetical protein [Encephalitozoon cuniculi GB-M1]|uniref:Uncharacterized protein n=1 Tax=Encephalitozoon cuniculi (strain GB-M1) TaxID=284813 RepID=Q8SUN1_ENCCU|nr:uncharacterized protein ECU08_1320 [Encephalitozoon cuniculi GB-M1]CAD26437.2 hypothetical protein [Encephalitozoon cuniculi GB-M1]
MQRAKEMSMEKCLLLAMAISICLARMYVAMSLLGYVVLQCIVVCLFILSVSIYGALRIRNGDKENKIYAERVARYDALDSLNKMEEPCQGTPKE